MARILEVSHHPTPDAGFGEFATVTERFTAVLDTPIGAITTLARELPELQFGKPHPDLRATFVTEFRPTHRGDTYAVYDIDVEYEQPQPQSGSSSSQSPSINPWDLAALIEHGSLIKREIPTEDAEGNKMENSSDEPLNAEFEVYYETIGISRSVRRRTRVPRGFRGAISKDSLVIDGDAYAAGQVRVISHTTRSRPPARFDELPYVEENTTLAINFDGWTRKFPNAGYYELVPSRVEGEPPSRERIRDAQGHPFAIPQWLDKSGQRPRREDGELLLPVPDNQRVFLDRYPGKRLALRRYLP